MGSEDGLSQNTAFSILFDSKGFMWIGTMNGLNRYDGYEFKIYRSSSENGNNFTNNRVTRLWEDQILREPSFLKILKEISGWGYMEADWPIITGKQIVSISSGMILKTGIRYHQILSTVLLRIDRDNSGLEPAR